MRGAFETFFPGAQWEGDGSTVVVSIFGHRFAFNLELLVDADSDAFIGFSVRDHEDGAAVIEAFENAVETTGQPPIAVELDRRPSNHTDEVKAALGDALLIPSTPGRPQSNPHVEGAHSLFQNAAPLLFINASTLREGARQLLWLIAMTWARTLNFKPRADRGGRSRVELYQDAKPTEDQVRQARQRLRERCRRQQRALETRRARDNPIVRQAIDTAFKRLGLDDPKGNVREAIARYPLDHVLDGIATYQGKRDAGRLPPTANARYLLGIVRNISDRDEGLRITEALITARLEARDMMLADLVRARDRLRLSTTDPSLLLRETIDRAMSTDRCIDRLFWLDVAASVINEQPEAEHVAMLRSASRRIHATFSVPYADRLAALRCLARKVIHLA